MKYKVGDKVLIRDDLLEDETYYDDDEIYHDTVNDSMVLFGGQIATITSITSTGYRINLDNSRWNWMDDMFNGKVKGIDISPFQSWENSISQ